MKIIGIGNAIVDVICKVDDNFLKNNSLTKSTMKLVDEDEFKKLGIRRLPKNLLQAIEALKNDKLADEVLGSVMKKSFLSYKNDEWERYHQAVTDWEVKEYLRLY